MKQSNLIPVKQFDKRVVLISKVGNGKTTIFNKCCKQNQPVLTGGYSVTRASFSSKSAYGNGFNMLDTPGIGSAKDKIGHVAGIASAFAEGPVHLVLIIVRFQRIDEIQNILTPMIYSQFKKYLSIIALAITFWDELERNYEINDSKEKKDQIQKEAKQDIQDMAKGLGIKEFFTVSKNTSGQEICFQIDRILQKYNQFGLHISLTPTEIQTFFSILQLNGQLQFSLDQAKEEVSTKFEKICNAAIIDIKKFNSTNPDMPDIMHAVCQQIKLKATQMIEDFQIQHMEIFNDIYQQVKDEKLVYLVDAELKCALVQQINSVIQAAQDKMQDYNFHCYHFIKSCPQCKTVWIKVDSCEGEVTCGRFPYYDDQIISSQMVPREFTITFTEKGMQCTSVQTQIQELKKKQYISYGSSNVRCGYTDQWTNFNNLTKEQIQILKEGQVLDFICQTVSDEKYKYSEKLSQNLQQVLQNTRVTKLN